MRSSRTIAYSCPLLLNALMDWIQNAPEIFNIPMVLLPTEH